MLNVTRFKCRALTLLLSTLILSSCLGNLSPFSQKTNYKISGIDLPPETLAYLEKTLENSLQEKLNYKKESNDFMRAETAREISIATNLLKALKAKGYYGAEVKYIDDDSKSLQGNYKIVTGEPYTISSLTITPKEMSTYFDFSIIDKGQTLDAIAVLTAQKKLYESIQSDKCYFSLETNHSVVLDKLSKTATLEYTVNIGPSATFGNTTFQEQDSVKESYLRKLIPWKEGDCFRHEKISALRATLLESGLFARADNKLPQAPDDDGHVPITIQLKERVHRSIKAGLNYYTDEGLSATIGWEHRNVLGAGEKLEAELNLSQINQNLDFNFTKPFFLRNDQNLSINSEIRKQNTDAFEETTIEAGTSLTRRFNKHLSASTALQLSISEIEDNEDKDTFGLLSFPNSITFDNRNNTLDPRKGWQLRAKLEPFYDILGESDPFTKLEIGARTYIDLVKKPDLILALRADAGSIIGSDTDNIPATQRFFAGGGGSVRGVGFQEIGPFENGDPTGGRTLITGATELRLKFTDTLGGVAFIDAGSISDNATPDLSSLSFGAGLGFRYYTDFGPLRFDVALPLNKTENLDQDYQFYISIGQAF